ncbi:fructose-bisphosphate aldolase-lysine N-methyltransferase, chloroplastic isoform X2 [Ziziphus jujuba]|uniref:Fructose-bisphosphate aldolase-lysine N-methyltransferase, chloroplastic isoform X2 n=1 Tax=Ziziphus jujuba TaxID=326968 RepID=A0A6P3ZFB1_ZIZJJ|nr:fructose-bisphosphate aldolase-lysine N-methyltransferase, chloroplastic isoform X2 [Ziziphus jujuba]
MLLGARITNLWRLRRPLLGMSQTQRSWIKLHFSCLSEVKVSHSLDDECDDFLPWLQRKAGVEISSVLSIGKSAYGRTLFASDIIQAGDCILSVPYNVQLSPDYLHPDINTLLNSEISYVAKLAIVVLVEQRLGQDSDWAPYISCLPQLDEMHNTIFWSEDELEMIHQSSVYKETINQKSLIEKEFLAVRPAFERFPEVFERITYKDFMHAYALVSSRAWGSTKGESLIPFADFLNHDGTSEAVVMSDEDKQLSEVIADRDYSPGEQVLIRYGKFSNATLLLDFGFTLPDNIHDQVHIQLNIPHHDPLREMKLEVLQRHHRPIGKDIHGINSSVGSFTIKEVKSASGKGKGIPQSLRAFARVLCCTSSQELRDLAVEAEQTDGRLARRSLKNINREIEAHRFLISQISQLIEDYHTSIESLGPLSSPFVSGKLALRRKMALDLLNGELRVLRSSYAWLENYCATWTTTDYHQ